ncbi:TldD/PmbA family protein [Candidatus Microgenomates bacterium]|nr:TldD/PmbA family protein [Candidatus Microgenomates bacterium]
MVGEKKLHEIAKKVLSLSRALRPAQAFGSEAQARRGKLETEVLLFVTDHGLTRFANSQIHQNVAWEDVGISVRVVIGKRIGVASTNSFAPSALRDVVRRAESLAKLQREDPHFKSLPKPQKLPKVAQWVHQATPEERAAAVSTIITKAREKKITASGAFDSVITEIVVANSHGVWAYHVSSASDLSTILLGKDSTGFGAQLGRKVADINAEDVAQQAIEKVERGTKPLEVKPGEWDVILEPQAVNEMMAFLAWLGPNARIYHEQASYFSGRLGEKVVGKNISIYDDPISEEGFPMPFDFEGVPKRKVEIIKEGVLKNLVYDSYHAGKHDAPNTGHALPAPNTGGPMPLHLVIEPGKKGMEEMIKGVKKGLLVTRFWYVRVLNPRHLSITGMTRDGTFLIKDGEIVGGVKNLRFNQSIPEALSSVAAISNTAVPLSSFELEIGSNRMPALHIKRWNFTSGTEF